MLTAEPDSISHSPGFKPRPDPLSPLLVIYNIPLPSPMPFILSFLYSILTSLMSHLTNFLIRLAKDVDFKAASEAPVDTDGAKPNTHAAETTIMRVIDFYRNPPFNPSDAVRSICPCRRVVADMSSGSILGCHQEWQLYRDGRPRNARMFFL